MKEREYVRVYVIEWKKDKTRATRRVYYTEMVWLNAYPFNRVAYYVDKT